MVEYVQCIERLIAKIVNDQSILYVTYVEKVLWATATTTSTEKKPKQAINK